MPEGIKPDNLREIYPALIVEVCEGIGTDAYPYQIVLYVIVDNKLIGKVERNVWNNFSKSTP